ncbi:hypothetical protein ACN28E_02545 [Archangium lansingense]|uniref:hypothetical protein n=1 Tax=Archangium lansingense TaxID=2995310 RepID=UPI003B7FD35A
MASRKQAGVKDSKHKREKAQTRRRPTGKQEHRFPSVQAPEPIHATPPSGD